MDNQITPGALSRRAVLAGSAALVGAALLDFSLAPAASASVASFYGNPNFRSQAYGVPTGTGFHRGEDIAPGGTAAVPALTSGTVAEVGTSTEIGSYLAVHISPAQYLIYCHMFRGSLPGSGSTITQGQVIGRLAGRDENPGTFWDGAHLHLVYSPFVDAAYTRSRATWDPNPLITSVLRGGGPSNTNTEDDMPKAMYFYSTSTSPSGVVAQGDIWVRTGPGEPLRRMSHGQAVDDWTLNGLDLNSPNVKVKDGNWFDAAFAEDNAIYLTNVAAHPWMKEI